MSEYPQLQDLELPTRAIRIFKEAGITTREQLCALPPSGVLRLPGLGRDTFRQILEALGKHQLSLAPEDWQSEAVAPSEVGAPSPPELQRRADLLAAKLTYACHSFNKLLDVLSVERIKNGMIIDEAYAMVKKAREHFDNGLAAIDAEHAPSEGTAS